MGEHVFQLQHPGERPSLKSCKFHKHIQEIRFENQNIKTSNTQSQQCERYDSIKLIDKALPYFAHTNSNISVGIRQKTCLFKCVSTTLI